jgi:hypothetical protein
VSEVDIAFLPDFREALTTGAKTATTRTSRHAKVGDTFSIFGHKFRVRAVVPMRLRDVHDFWWREEGVRDPLEFRRVWMRLHPRRGFVDSDRVFLHLFRLNDPARLEVTQIWPPAQEPSPSQGAP